MLFPQTYIFSGNAREQVRIWNTAPLSNLLFSGKLHVVYGMTIQCTSCTTIHTQIIPTVVHEVNPHYLRTLRHNEESTDRGLRSYKYTKYEVYLPAGRYDIIWWTLIQEPSPIDIFLAKRLGNVTPRGTAHGDERSNKPSVQELKASTHI